MNCIGLQHYAIGIPGFKHDLAVTASSTANSTHLLLVSTFPLPRFQNHIDASQQYQSVVKGQDVSNKYKAFMLENLLTDLSLAH
jgi:hypothetical protein